MAPKSPESADRKEAAAKPGQSGQTILLVEDEENVLSLAAQVLRKRKYNVLEAKNGAEALAHAREHEGPIHLILADVVLPDINGHEVATAVLKTRPEALVLYTSGYTDDVVATHGIHGRRWRSCPNRIDLPRC